MASIGTAQQQYICIDTVVGMTRRLRPKIQTSLSPAHPLTQRLTLLYKRLAKVIGTMNYDTLLRTEDHAVNRAVCDGSFTTENTRFKYIVIRNVEEYTYGIHIMHDP